MFPYALCLAAGYTAYHCIHTPQGRKLAKTAVNYAMRNMGNVENAIKKAAKKTPINKDVS